MTIKLIENINIGKPTWYSVYVNDDFVKGSFSKTEAYEYYKDVKEELISPKKYGTNILKEEEITLPLDK